MFLIFTDATECAAAGRRRVDKRHFSQNLFSGEVVSRSDAREVVAAWHRTATVATGIHLALAGPGAGGSRPGHAHAPNTGQTTCIAADQIMAKKTFLDFEQPIAELETKIEELRYVQMSRR